MTAPAWTGADFHTHRAAPPAPTGEPDRSTNPILTPKPTGIRKDGSCLRVNGWYLDDSGRPADFSALINGRPGPAHAEAALPPDAAGRYAR